MSGVHALLPSMLFVDESNTRLGVMAEHVARWYVGDVADVTSAGFDVRESRASERAVACLRSRGLLELGDVVGAPRRLRDVDVAAYDIIVALSQAAAAKVPRALRARGGVWNVRDPWQGSDDSYAEACEGLCRAMEDMLVARARSFVAA